MMKKTCGGFLLSRAGFCLLGVCFFGWGSSRVSAQETALVSTESEVNTESSFRDQIAHRLEVFKSADLETLKAAQEECMKKASELSTKIPELRQQIKVAYDEARKNAPEIKEMEKQIRAMQANLEQAIGERPEIQEKLQAIEQTERDMLAELQFRTALGGLIARKNREGIPSQDVE